MNTEQVIRIHAALPQTQCQRCDYDDCLAYAQAIMHEGAPINQCPPGGAEGVRRLAALTGKPIAPLNPDNGYEGPLTVAYVDEQWCIGCTLCIKVCPTDAIVGTNKSMHTVIESECVGCELCIPACPVDCIELEPVNPNLSGWAAWTQEQADHALARYEARKSRLEREAIEHDERLAAKALHKLENLDALTTASEASPVDQKRATIEAALARAKARQKR